MPSVGSIILIPRDEKYRNLPIRIACRVNRASYLEFAMPLKKDVFFYPTTYIYKGEDLHCYISNKAKIVFFIYFTT